MTARQLVPAAVLLVSAAVHADVIFNSLRMPLGSGGQYWVMTDSSLGEPAAGTEFAGGFENERQVGAAISFVGTDRCVTRIEVGGVGFGNGGNNIDLAIAIYTDAGGTPGSLIWSGVKRMTIPFHGAKALVAFAPNVVLPDTVFYALTYESISNPANTFGAFWRATPPVIGTAAQMMTQDSTTLAWAPSPGTTPQYCMEMRITAVACYPDCDGDGALTLADFGCFQTSFALAGDYADCNGDGMINLADFGCFQTRFALGCP